MPDYREDVYRAKFGKYRVHDVDDNGVTSTLTGVKQCLDVNLGASDVSIGGGSQYTEGDTTDPAVGTAVLGRNPSGGLEVPEMNASNVLKTDGSGVTQPVSAASLPLPSGASTSAKQDDIIAAIQAVTEYSVVRTERTSSADFQLVAAGGAGVYTYLKYIQIINNDDSDMTFRLADAGTVLPKQYVPAFGGQVLHEFPGKGLKQTAANDGLDFDVISVGASPDFSVTLFYFQE